jgi:hypothetical protein
MPGTLVKEEDIKRLRASQMVALRVQGMTLEDIGLQFNCDRNAVARHLAWAGKQGIISGAEERILDELVPLAINTYKTALENGDTFAAKHIIDKLGEMAERAEKRQTKGEDRLFEAWMKEREEGRRANKSGKDQSAPVDGESRPNPEDVIDATVIQTEGSEDVGEDGPRGPERRAGSAFVSADEILHGASEDI